MSALTEAAKTALIYRNVTHIKVAKTTNATPPQLETNLSSSVATTEPNHNIKAKLLLSVLKELARMAPNSLVAMCKNKLMKEVDNLTDIGNIPFELIQPVLQRISRPDQLRKLEISCSQLQGKTGDIWMKLIQRDAGKHAESIENADIKDWYKTYIELKARQDRDNEKARDVLAARMSAIHKQNNQNKAELDLDGTLVPENSPNRKGRKSAVVKMQEAKREGITPVVRKFAPGPSSKPSAIKKIMADVRKDYQNKGLAGAKRKSPGNPVLVAAKKRRT